MLLLFRWLPRTLESLVRCLSVTCFTVFFCSVKCFASFFFFSSLHPSMMQCLLSPYVLSSCCLENKWSKVKRRRKVVSFIRPPFFLSLFSRHHFFSRSPSLCLCFLYPLLSSLSLSLSVCIPPSHSSHLCPSLTTENVAVITGPFLPLSFFHIPSRASSHVYPLDCVFRSLSAPLSSLSLLSVSLFVLRSPFLLSLMASFFFQAKDTTNGHTASPSETSKYYCSSLSSPATFPLKLALLIYPDKQKHSLDLSFPFLLAFPLSLCVSSPHPLPDPP